MASALELEPARAIATSTDPVGVAGGRRLGCGVVIFFHGGAVGVKLRLGRSAAGAVEL